ESKGQEAAEAALQLALTVAELTEYTRAHLVLYPVDQPYLEVPLSAPYPVSILDLAPVSHGQPIAESLQESTALAVLADQLGFKRLWFAEHHNMKTIASSATSVLLAHIGAHTNNIRLGEIGRASCRERE